MRPSNNLENKTLSDTYWRNAITCIKVQANSFSEPLLEYNQDQTPLMFLMTFLTILGIMDILCSFRLVLERKAGKEIPKSSRLEFLEKFLGNNFVSSDVEDNPSRLFNRGSTADLPLLRTLIAIHQSPKSQVSAKWLTFLFLQHMQIQQLQEPFRNNY